MLLLNKTTDKSQITLLKLNQVDRFLFTAKEEYKIQTL